MLSLQRLEISCIGVILLSFFLLHFYYITFELSLLLQTEVTQMGFLGLQCHRNSLADLAGLRTVLPYLRVASWWGREEG